MKQRIATNIKTKSDAWAYLFEQEVGPVKRLYFKKEMTAREVCTIMGVSQHYEADPNSFNKAFHRKLGTKGLGHGGARPNAGMKKGTKLCPVCRKSGCKHKEDMTASVHYKHGKLSGEWPVLYKKSDNPTDGQLIKKGRDLILRDYPNLVDVLDKCEWSVKRK